MRRQLVFGVMVVLYGCSNSGGLVEQSPEAGQVVDLVVDLSAPSDLAVVPDAYADAEEVYFEVGEPTDVGPDLPVAQCDPGEGCFLDGCTTNEECQSGWCVQHLGESVCSKTCQQECPPGWNCSQVAGTDPDVVYICVSDYANLCRPCASNDNCTSTGGAEDACLHYGLQGSFCGAPCGKDESCPWGFSCQEMETVDGALLKQCVNETGDCPCTQRSVALGLFTPCSTQNDFGTCSGKRICMADGLSQCDAGDASVEICNGVDDDCDGEVDEPLLLGGDYVNLCDDGSDCTDDECAGEEGCVNLLLDAGQCNDENPCTVADHCVGGECVGTAVECDDKNPCTGDICTDAGGCEFPPVAGKCDDGDPCTVGDICDAGVCTGTAVPCQCQAHGDCAGLEDGDKCNGTLICDTEWPPYKCIVAPDSVVECPAPEGSDAPCLVASCDPLTGACSLEPANDGAACTDGNPCTVSDECAGGECVAGAPVNCNDGNPCTDDSCDAATGCFHVPNTAACADGNVCTTQDQCNAGECVGGPALVCDDGDLCTGIESCDPGVGCVAGTPLVCDDGNVCNGVESCNSVSGCLDGEPLSCDDGNPCTADSCHPKSGCQHLESAGACDDGNACTTGDSCVDGQCIYESLLVCDDENVCTDDSCDPKTGCITKINVAPCDDGDVCTTGDHCFNGGCQSSGQLNCDDGNSCTADSCSALEGCLHAVEDGPCDDGNACTVGDHCLAGACVKGGLVNCNDDNVCTNDTCDPDTGCVSTLNTAPCDDGDLCTTGDTCHLGECLGTGNLHCDDGNICTDDSCAPEAGCQFVSNSAACDDGNACTDGDVCQAGWCHPGPAAVCDDGNDCTIDTCEPDAGCGTTFAENGAACIDEGVAKVCVDGVCVCEPDCAGKACGPDGCGGSCGSCQDEDACTLDEACVDGLCQSTPLVCNDGNGCTDDSCAPEIGCVFANNSAACDDGNPCTANDVCAAGGCSGEAIPQLAPYQFTNASATGRIGPNQSQLDNAYAGTNLAGDVTSNGGIQNWTVPFTGTYTIKAAGAKGGDAPGGGGAANTSPGFGAIISGDFQLEAGTQLKVVVGQMGAPSKQSGWAENGCSGGGGGSYVYVDANDSAPLLVAAGGGGQAEDGKGGHGSATTAPTTSTGGSGPSGAGGNGGNGGAYGPNPHSYTSGAGGGGWLTNGADSPTVRNPGGKGGQAPRNGAQGGFGTHNSYGAEHCSGGFGGGGAGADNTGAGGGGGGYNGGGGGRNYTGSWGAAGGAGSFNAGANDSAQSGANSTHGYVTITFECN